jgi:hypothetical protein
MVDTSMEWEVVVWGEKREREREGWYYVFLYSK